MTALTIRRLIQLSDYPESWRRDLLEQAVSEGRQVIVKLYDAWVYVYSDYTPPSRIARELGRQGHFDSMAIEHRAALRYPLASENIGELLKLGYCVIPALHPRTIEHPDTQGFFDAESETRLVLEKACTLNLPDVYIEWDTAPEIPSVTKSFGPTISLHKPSLVMQDTIARTTPSSTVKPKLKPLEIPAGHDPTLRLKLAKIVHDEIIELHPKGDWSTGDLFIDSKVSDEAKRYGGVIYDERNKLIESIASSKAYKGNAGLQPDAFESDMLDLTLEMLRTGKCSASVSRMQVEELLNIALPTGAVGENLSDLLMSKRGLSPATGQHMAVDDLLNVINSEQINFKKTTSSEILKEITAIVKERDECIPKRYLNGLKYVLTPDTK